MSSQKADEFVKWLTMMASHEGVVIIAPHAQPFRPKERSFLDGIRTVPARITAPAGTDPFQLILRRPGHWMFIWVPE